jgi:pimeloyl-ACP methyl ester carboxylesterase
MRRITRLQQIGALAFMVLGASARGAGPPGWGTLTPGPFTVGFKSSWRLDPSRAYNRVFGDKTTYASGKSPRPMLINMWYPAEPAKNLEPMPHRGYLDIRSTEPQFSKFADELIGYEQDVVCTEIMRKRKQELTGAERRLLEGLWNAVTAAVRNAPPVGRRFPLVIYHSGGGSSFEDNAVLCEFLASHGYVVLGSAFQEPTGASYNIDGRLGSARDMEYLIAYANGLPDVDWKHIGIVGHSAGAQAALMFQAQDASPVDAVVSLDTTQDYTGLSDHRWDDMIKPILENRSNSRKPLLFLANCHAVFEFADQLTDAERYYLTFRDMGHNDFISQGIRRRDVESLAHPDDQARRNERDAARSAYTIVCECVVDFFDAYLKGDQNKKRALIKNFESNPLGGTAPHIRLLARGVSEPEPFQDGSKMPPEPRQVRPLLAKRGADATIAILKSYHEKEPVAPVFQRNFGFALVYELLENGQVREAVAFHRMYRSVGQDLVKIFISSGDSYLRQGAKTRAGHYFESARTLDPENSEAADRLRKMREAKKD